MNEVIIEFGEVRAHGGLSFYSIHRLIALLIYVTYYKTHPLSVCDSLVFSIFLSV